MKLVNPCTPRKEVVEAAKDYKYLLNRGYSYLGALELVTSRYLLSKEERALLYRCIHPDIEVNEIRMKYIKPDGISGETLIVDGYNVLITIASAIEGRCLYICDDGFVRDLRSTYIKNFATPSITESIEVLANYLLEIRPKKVIIYLDKNVSKSKQHKYQLSVKMREKGIPADVNLAEKTDTIVIVSQGIISTSDILILKKAGKITDIAGEIIMTQYPKQLARIDKNQ